MLSGRTDKGKLMSIIQVSLINNEIHNNYDLLGLSGSNYGTHICDCHNEAEGCIEEETKHNTCNCDANLPIPSTDTGDNFASFSCNLIHQEQSQI